jgi:hypothetical protein
MRSLLIVVLCCFSLNASASLMEIEKHCLQMYQKRMPKEKMKQLCFCITSNLFERFSASQLEDLTQIYKRKRGRYEASKSDHARALVEFDYFAHSNCQRDSLWRFPKDDIGKPDAITD